MTWVFVACAVLCNGHDLQVMAGLTAAQCKTLLALTEVGQRHDRANAGYAACIAPDGRALTKSLQIAEPPS